MNGTIEFYITIIKFCGRSHDINHVMLNFLAEVGAGMGPAGCLGGTAHTQQPGYAIGGGRDTITGASSRVSADCDWEQEEAGTCIPACFAHVNDISVVVLHGKSCMEVQTCRKTRFRR